MEKSLTLTVLNEGFVFEIAKTIHNAYPDVSTEDIYGIILYCDSIDVATDMLYASKVRGVNINDIIKEVLLSCEGLKEEDDESVERD